jgi:2-methylcitrate dehydratase PrpD
MNSTSEDDIAQSLATWATQFSAHHVSGEVAEEALRCIVDTIGVSLAGIAHPHARLSQVLTRDTYGAGPCHVLGNGSISTSAPGAAFCNGVAAHVLDYDDVSYEGMVHASAVVWPAVLAAGELVEATGQDVLTAFVCAVEAEYALGRALTHDLFWRGWWTTGLLGSIGAAIGAAKVMGLDAATTRDAINIATCQATGPYVLVGSPVKPYACGRAAEAGVQAALAARQGLQGPTQAFEHANGFIAMYGDNRYVPEELAQLGSRFVLSTSRVAFKRYPVCSAGQSSIEAMQAVMARNAIGGEDVALVRAEVTSDVAHYMAVQRATSITEAQFCLPFCLACVMQFSDLTPRHIALNIIEDPSIINAMTKAEVVHSSELDQLCSSREDYQMSARLTVTTRDGRELTELVAAPSGLPVNPMSDKQIDAKFLSCTQVRNDGIRDPKTLLARIRGLASLASCRDLYR